MEDLKDYQQKLANELFVMVHGNSRTEARIEVEKIMREQIAKEIEDYRTAWCRCEKELLPLCEHLINIQNLINTCG